MSSTLSVTVLLFARACELTGESSIVLNLPVDASAPALTLTNIRSWLQTNRPALSALLSSPSTLLTHNASYVDNEDFVVLKSGDEVAVVPPVSGG